MNGVNRVNRVVGSAVFLVGVLSFLGCESDEDRSHETEGHETETGGTSGSGSSGGAGDAVESWCSCMLSTCHDDYHDAWGEDHDQSFQMCLDAGAAVPSAGMEVSEGNFIECRLQACLGAPDDPSLCDAAMGRITCVDP